MEIDRFIDRKGLKIEEQEEQREKKKEVLYTKGRAKAVIFVPATAQSQLQRTFVQEIRDRGFREVWHNTETDAAEIGFLQPK